MGDDGEKSVEKPDGWNGSKKDEPEVEEDVDLLIYDIQRKDT